MSNARSVKPLVRTQSSLVLVSTSTADLLTLPKDEMQLNSAESKRAQSEEVAKLAQKLGQLQHFIAVSHRNAWPTCIFLANLSYLTPFSLQGRVR
jgi:hypothetical protein